VTDELRIDEMILVLRREMPRYSVVAASDFDRGAVTFRFDRDGRIQHILKISEELLSDYSPSEILNRLETAQWRRELTTAGRNPILLTSDRLQRL